MGKVGLRWAGERGKEEGRRVVKLRREDEMWRGRETLRRDARWKSRSQ
jgi:hypothetical protein